MSGKWQIRALTLVLVVAGVAVWRLAAQTPSPEERRATLTKTFNAGNFKDAYEGFRKLALDPMANPRQVGKDLEMALKALQRLGRIDEARVVLNMW